MPNCLANLYNYVFASHRCLTTCSVLYSTFINGCVPVSAQFIAMANRVRRRNHGQLLTSEDVMANEPDFSSADAGPHAPMYYHATDKYDKEERLIHKDISVDSSGSWFSRTRESLRGDISSICLLLFLYLLQGVPLGLIAAIPLLLQSKHVSYGQQAIFSFAYWPFRSDIEDNISRITLQSSSHRFPLPAFVRDVFPARSDPIKEPSNT
ncbi:hypothetical protein GCK32_006219 [Trichostrongylus colubriformis]|uniref:Uncharacterized protein n=1 Tax=Trichostrongylus colubriformis TaxID=6319 RepID=A0AAN8FKS8_TRICO